MPWKLGLLLGLVFAVFGGIGGFVFGAAIGIVLSLLFKSATKPSSREARSIRESSNGREIRNPPPLPFHEPQMVRVPSAKVPALMWVEPGVQITVQGILIPGGMIYQSAKPQSYPGEPSAICSALTVSHNSDDPSLDLGYYPSYDQIATGQRRTYLEWLAAGRTDSNPASRSLGYLFMFFYGLERRVIIEKDNDPRLVEERIKALTQETHEVISLLSEVMVEDEEVVPVAAVVVATPSTAAGLPEWLQTLEERYRSACIEVIAHDSLSLETFDGIAKKHHLLPDDLFTAINGWSDEQLGDFLLERETEVRVFRDLLPDRNEVTIA